MNAPAAIGDVDWLDWARLDDLRRSGPVHESDLLSPSRLIGRSRGHAVYYGGIRFSLLAALWRPEAVIQAQTRNLSLTPPGSH